MKLMEDLVRFYEHFGIRAQPGDHPDHLSTELEFMHYLCFKEAAAASHGKDPAPLVRAETDFLGRHLCRWLPRVAQRLEGLPERPPLYPDLARIAEQFCRSDLRTLKEVWGKSSPEGEAEAGLTLQRALTDKEQGGTPR
jgi:DMSO reductase family type II enzyme chaperone